MRIDAYNAISKIYSGNRVSSTKKIKNGESFTDRLEISQAGKDMKLAKEAVNSASDVRMDKVNDIKARIAAGTYNISSEAVADKILQNAAGITF